MFSAEEIVMSDEPVVIMTTTNTEREAKQIAEVIVREKLAACVQIIPKIHSIYEWQGKIHSEQEYLLLIKTFDKLTAKVRKKLEDEHSYEVFEFLVTPVIEASDEYAEWMKKVTK